MKYGFHAEAEREYTDAIAYYRGINSKLAAAFISEIEHGIHAIQRNPLT